MKVKVLRAFCIRGERQEIGAELDVADAFGRQLVQLGQAAPVTVAAPPKGVPKKPPPMTTLTAGALVAGGKQQEI
jgi:hypothetical protein